LEASAIRTQHTPTAAVSN